jgi:hypothetical protein
MRSGLCGAHRVGKTELASRIAVVLGVPFIETRTSDVFRKAGHDPAQPMDFETRMRVQHLVLDAAESLWNGCISFVTDRTPMDMLAYLLADIQGGTSLRSDEVAEYAARCFRLTNRYFDAVAVIQPGIPLVDAPGKAANNPAYIEHVNSLVLGLVSDERLHLPYFTMRRTTLDIHERMHALDGFIKRVGARSA